MTTAEGDGSRRPRGGHNHGGRGPFHGHPDGGEGSFHHAAPSEAKTIRDGMEKASGGRRGEEREGWPPATGRRTPPPPPPTKERERVAVEEARRRAEDWRRANIPPEWGKLRDLGMLNSSIPVENKQRYINQRCRSEIIQRIDKEEQGVKLRRLGWESEEERERIARSIRRSLFGTNSPPRGHDSTTSEESAQLEAAFSQLEVAMGKIPSAELREQASNKAPNGELKGGEQKGGDLLTPAYRFGRSIEDIFCHSWRAERKAIWIWVPKPALLGEEGFPARAEEIRREGWKAKRVVRVRSPPPISRSFASVVQGEKMARDQGRPMRGVESGEGSKRRFEDERFGDRFRQGRGGNNWGEDE
ncbi:unnamed protein product [Urochloa humidicola]